MTNYCKACWDVRTEVSQQFICKVSRCGVMKALLIVLHQRNKRFKFCLQHFLYLYSFTFYNHLTHIYYGAIKRKYATKPTL